MPPASLAGDKFTRVSVDKQVVEGIGQVWLSFININDNPTTATPGAQVGGNATQSIYLASPDGARRLLKVLDLSAKTDRRVYWSPNGAYLAYFLEEGADSGLYVLDLKVGVSVRMFAAPNLNPRGIAGDPIWAPDGARLTITLATPYDLDVFSVGADGSGFRNLTQSGGFDFWPAWSPDGQYMAFVSDRAQCPSWAPNETRTCFRPDGSATIPDGGALYVLESVSGQIRQVSDSWVTAPPHWVSSSRLAFTSGKSGDPAAGTTLQWVDLRGGAARAVTAIEPGGILILRDAWNGDGSRVLYQEAGAQTALVLRDDSGTELARSTELTFPRYAFTAAWSPDGKRVVIGGNNSQCPYPIVVADNTLKIQVRAAPPNPRLCDPQWSPDSKWIAFAGILQSGGGSDGRFDAYVAEPTGFGARNLSGRLRGQIKLLGWVGRP